jgi:cbb3-type cytochrome oxidase subunit 3
MRHSYFMIQNILRHLGGIEHYGVLSLCLFCAVFLGVLLWAFLQKKTHLDYMARVALDADLQESSPKTKDSNE